MTEQQLREKVVSIMVGWLGYNEVNGKYKKIIDIYNAHKPLAQGYKVKYSDEWCATASSAAFIQAGLTDIAPTECNCGRMITLFKKIGRWQERDDYVPKPGDIIMYYWKDGTNYATTDCTATPNHVGIVEKVSGKTLTIIEGNKGESVSRRTLTVNGRYIRGYCLPDYAGKANGKVNSEPAKPAQPTIKTDPAKSFSRTYAKTYAVTASALNMRRGAGTNKTIIKALPKGSKVTCYGYFTKVDSTVWLYVKDGSGTVGFCSKKYLK